MVKSGHNPGWMAGIGQRSRVKQLAWSLKGAPMRKKDLRLNAVSGIAEGRKLRDRVTALMLRADANPEDAMVFCIFAEPDLSALIPEMARLGIKNGASDISLAAKHPDKLPIGFLVFVLDRNDPERPIFGHARPLIVEDPRGIELNAQALDSYERQIKRRLMEAGEISDERN
jgi:hypothetical protein